MKSTESNSIWAQPPEILELLPDRADVWRIRVDLPVAIVNKLASTLSADEVRRADRFHFPADRQRYIAAHGGLRDILARYLGCESNGLRFSANDHGKPVLLSQILEFNLSHSGDFALVAITQNRKIGIDVERIRSGMEFERIARRFFSPSEVSEWMALPPAQRQIAFFNCWARKEAYMKAHGLGLSLPLDSFDDSLGEPAILRTTRPNPGEAGCWILLSLDVDPAYTAAMAVEHSALSSSKGDVPSNRPEPVEGPSKDTTLSPSKVDAASNRPESVEGPPKNKSLAFRFWDWNTHPSPQPGKTR
jgi:4'-phosphopantetheinyl transferase